MKRPDKALSASQVSYLSKDKVRNSKLKQNYPLIISVASGKGGVGKTLTIVNFALAASQMGHKVLILDGDLGLANVDIVLGLKAKYNIKDVFDGLVPLSRIILDGPFGIKIIPSGSGITSLHTLSYTQKQILVEQLERIQDDFNLLLIDTGAGIGPNVLHLSSIAHRRVIVTTGEPHAITDAYALIKVLAEEKNLGSFDLLLNMVHSVGEAQVVAHKIKEVAHHFLGVKINYLGFIPVDARVNHAVLQRQAASSNSFQTLAGQAWKQTAQELLQNQSYKNQAISMHDFWKNLVRPERNCSFDLASS